MIWIFHIKNNTFNLKLKLGHNFLLLVFELQLLLTNLFHKADFDLMKSNEKDMWIFKKPLLQFELNCYLVWKIMNIIFSLMLTFTYSHCYSFRVPTYLVCSYTLRLDATVVTQFALWLSKQHTVSHNCQFQLLYAKVNLVLQGL